MPNEPSQFSPVFRIDVSAEPQAPNTQNGAVDPNTVMAALLRQLLASQEKQNQLLEQLIQQKVQAQKQRASELQQWKDANPHLARSCRKAAEALSEFKFSSWKHSPKKFPRMKKLWWMASS